MGQSPGKQVKMGLEKQLSSQRWKAVKPLCQKAAATGEQLMQRWAQAAHEAVKDAPAPLWRYLLLDLKRLCEEDGIDVPYGSPYLVTLAQTYEAVKGDFKRGVSLSVLVEGRHLPNLLKVLKPGMTVADIKAHVQKAQAPEDTRTPEEIAAENRRVRKEADEAAKVAAVRKKKINSAAATDPSVLLEEVREDVRVYAAALISAQSAGAEFEANEVHAVMQAVKDLLTTMGRLVVEDALAVAA